MVERTLSIIPIAELSGTDIFRATIGQICPYAVVDQWRKMI